MEEDRVVCQECGQINPFDCKRINCPLESYFWSLDDRSDN